MANLRISSTITGGLVILTAATPVAAADRAICESGWSGSANYSRQFASNTSKSGQRISDDGTETESSSITSDYAAQFAVRPGTEPGTSIARADIKYTQSAKQAISASVQSRCANDRTIRTMTGQTTTESRVRAGASGTDADVSASMNDDGTYSVGVGTGEISGMVSGSDSSTFSGQCSPQPNRSNSLGETPTSVQGYTFESDGTNRVDPRNPSQLSGSYSVTNFGVTETLKWNLRRCAGELYLVDLKFEDMKFPTWEAWQEIVEQRGTIDGNRVRITATVANDGAQDETITVKFKETYKGDKWNGAKPDAVLDELSVEVPAGQRREVQFQWDTSGYAWFDDGRPRPIQRIRAELVSKGKLVGEKVGNLKIAPKPIVLVHGIWSDWRAFAPWQNILTTTHSYDWKAYSVGEKPEHGRMSMGKEWGTFERTKSPLENSREIESYVKYAQEDRNAWHIDMVAHSLGGLASRRYVAERMPTMPDKKPQVTHLLMLGTPNLGSNCANMILAFSEIALNATGGRKESVFHDISNVQIEGFNKIIQNRNGVPFSALAGKKLPIMCGTAGWNDGLVTVNSAIGLVEDHAEISATHNDLLGAEAFSFFVKPRLTLGPGKQVPVPVAEPTYKAKLDSDPTASTGPSNRVTGLSKGGAVPSASANLSSAMRQANSKPSSSPGITKSSKAATDNRIGKVVELAPNSTTTIEFPIEDAPNLGIVFVAPPGVSATLKDASGAVAGENRTGTPAAMEPFRSIIVDRPIASGKWTVSLTNQGPATQEVIVGSWSDANPTPR